MNTPLVKALLWSLLLLTWVFILVIIARSISALV
jgi:hypothetical protein